MIKKIQLKNGLQVIMVPSAKSPVVSVQMWVRTGSADEGRGVEGISHFIEHLVFKGTQKYKVGEIASIVEGSGGELNAYTSFDQTVFYVTISKAYFETGLDVIAEMMGFPTFDKAEIDNEREVVIEEIKRGNDSLGRQASQLLFKTAFKKSAYRIPVIGFDKNIMKVSAKKIQDYYRSRYTPPNMFLVVTGDFDLKDGQKKIEKVFSRLEKTPLKKVKRVKEPKQTTPRVAVQSTQFQQSIGYCAWKIPGAGHKDIPALDVLALVLGQGDSSRLVKRLRIDEPLVSSIGTGNYLPQEGGLFMLSYGFEKEKFGQIHPVIQGEIERFMREGPTAEELKKAIVNLESGEYYSMETVDGLARRYGSVEFQFRDLKAFDRYFKALRALTPKMIQEAAIRYLKPETLSITLTSQGDVKPLQTECKKWIASMKVKKAPLKKASDKKPKFERFKSTKLTKKEGEIQVLPLSTGARLLVRPSTATEVISAKAAFMGGLRYENMSSQGLSELFSRTWVAGTKTRSEAQLFEEIDQIAGSVSPVVGRNSSGMSLDVLKSFEHQGCDLFLDSLFNSTFPDEVVEREKKLQIQQIKHKKDNPSGIMFNLFLKEMFAGHPYSKDPLGTEEGLQKMSGQDVREFWRQTYDPTKLHFVVAGNVDPEFWRDQIEKNLKSHAQASAKTPSLSLGKLAAPKQVFERSEKEQSHVLMGYRSFDLRDERRHVLQIIQSVLAGQGGRLFLELRDKESLAYSVSPTRLEGLEGGYFGAYIGCSPEKTKKALSMMKTEFEKLMNEPVPQEELDRAKRYMIGRHDIDLQRTASIASSILYEDLYGLDFNEVFNYKDLIAGITSEDLRRVAREVFSGPAITAIVGPETSLG
ncbi:MAG: insulinase family protein [Bdellovibrionaceae bacterium]|nr:insulinase family protein [Pseudobdellovibrionaceae bacterium]